MSECPHSWSEPVGGKASQGQAGKAIQRCRALFVAQDLLSDESTKDVGHFTIDEIRNGKFFGTEAVGIEIVRDEFDYHAGSDDLQSLRPSCSAVRMTSRSARPRTLAWVSRITAALSRTTWARLARCLSSRSMYRVRERP